MKNTLKTIKRFSFTIFACLFLATSSQQKVCASGGSSATKKIYLIHWQKEGRTGLGDTFVNFLKSKYSNIEYIERFAEQDAKKMPGFIAEIRNIKPDLIYVYSTTGILELAGAHDAVNPAKHITDIPIVAVAHSEPIGTGIVKEINAPTGRNVTGVGHHVTAKTAVGIMQEYVSPVKRIGVLISDEKNSKAGAENLRKLETEKGFKASVFVHKMEGTKIAQGSIDENVVNILKEKPDIIYLPSDGVNINNVQAIIASFVKHKDIHAAPIFTTVEKMVTDQNSCTFALFTTINVMGLMAGVQAEAILFKGKKVQEMPYQLGSQMTLAIRQDTMTNLKTYPFLSLIETAEIFK